MQKVYDHAKHKYRFDFRMLTLGGLNRSTFFCQQYFFIREEEKRVNEAASLDERSIGYRRRALFMQKGTHTMLEHLDAAGKAVVPAKYVFFDSWFSSLSILHTVKSMDYDVISG